MSDDLKIVRITLTADSINKRLAIEVALAEYENALLQDGVSPSTLAKRKALLDKIDAYAVAMHKMASAS